MVSKVQQDNLHDTTKYRNTGNRLKLTVSICAVDLGYYWYLETNNGSPGNRALLKTTFFYPGRSNTHSWKWKGLMSLRLFWIRI